MQDERIELVVKDIKPPSNYQGKVNFINGILQEIRFVNRNTTRSLHCTKK